MNPIHYRDGCLYVEDVPADGLIEEFGSPLYVYSHRALVEQVALLQSAFRTIKPKICFSVKCCSSLGVLRALGELGVSLDVVSGGELFRGLKAGIPPQNIVFAGVGKSSADIRYGLKAGIYMFNAESIEEVQRIDALAVEEGVRAKVCLRVNVDVVDTSTLDKTSTGGRKTKFGIPMPDVAELFSRRWQAVDLCGLHFHLGSPISRVEVYLAAIERTLQLMANIQAIGGHVNHLNIGGGFPVQYEEGHPQFDDLQRIASSICHRLESVHREGVRILIEPGRIIAANSCVLLTTVEYLKKGWKSPIAILDIGMNGLLRPAMYGAFHTIWPTVVAGANADWLAVKQYLDQSSTQLSAVDVVGPICETSDYFAWGRPLPPFSQGDHLAVFSAGAYGMSMASQYNSQPMPAEVMIQGSEARLIRHRESYDDLVARETNVEPPTRG